MSEKGVESTNENKGEAETGSAGIGIDFYTFTSNGSDREPNPPTKRAKARYVFKVLSIRLLGFLSILGALVFTIFIGVALVSEGIQAGGVLYVPAIFLLIHLSFLSAWRSGRWVRREVGEYWDLTTPPHDFNYEYNSEWAVAQAVLKSTVFRGPVVPLEPFGDRSPSKRDGIVALHLILIGVMALYILVLLFANLPELGVTETLDQQYTTNDVSLPAAVLSTLAGGPFGLVLLIIVAGTNGELVNVLFLILILIVTGAFWIPGLRNLSSFFEDRYAEMARKSDNPMFRLGIRVLVYLLFILVCLSGISVAGV